MEPAEPPPLRLLVCVNRRFGRDRPSCAARGSEKLLKALVPMLAALDPPIAAFPAPCQGRCSRGPVVRVMPAGTLLLDIHPSNSRLILDHIITGGCDDS
jgi:(2Fe-2S) ferredoxin